MLFNLLSPLADDFGLFNLFRYLTFRTGGAVLTALVISFVVGPPLIAWLRAKQGEGDFQQSLSIVEEALRLFPEHAPLLTLEKELNKELNRQLEEERMSASSTSEPKPRARHEQTKQPVPQARPRAYGTF